MEVREFQRVVRKYWKVEGRHDLPWRKTTDPYRILVSEVMLQQTQVERVLPYYAQFLKRFPTVSTLASASLSEVLIVWQGLGYNRRAKMLHETAKVVVQEYGGKFPTSAPELQMLPGVGPYTAGAVTAFAYNKDGIFVETNIRTVITHHFFADKTIVSDTEIREVLEKVFPKGKAREWYSALMDYGAHLKRTGIRINAKAKGYTKQSAFAGSNREARGAILRALSCKPETHIRLLVLLGPDRKVQIEEQISKLSKERMIHKKRAHYTLAS